MLKAGFSLLHHVATTATNTVIGFESSDEDDPIPDNIDESETAPFHSRGILEFKAVSRANKEKRLLISLQKGTLTQFYERRRKVIFCGDIHSIAR
jgi:hypothetical protein